MLNVGALREGYVLDHIKAGKAMTIYHDLKLDKLDCTVAIIKNARSNKMGKKDIIKVECPIEDLDLDILGFIDHNITVNIIKDEKIVEKNNGSHHSPLLQPGRRDDGLRCGGRQRVGRDPGWVCPVRALGPVHGDCRNCAGQRSGDAKNAACFPDGQAAGGLGFFGKHPVPART